MLAFVGQWHFFCVVSIEVGVVAVGIVSLRNTVEPD